MYFCEEVFQTSKIKIVNSANFKARILAAFTRQIYEYGTYSTENYILYATTLNQIA